MKKAIAAILAMLMVLPFAFADISLYGDYSDSQGDAIVGDRGYVDVRYYETEPDVFVCGYSDGTITHYGMNLRNDMEISYATRLVEWLSEQSFAGFSHYGCLRARI